MYKFNLFVQEEYDQPDAVPTVSKRRLKIEVKIEGLDGFSNGK